MGCGISAFVDADTPQAGRGLADVPGWFEEWEQIFSRFRPDSDLNRLNAAAGQAVPVHPALFAVVQAALEAARWTGGLVVPSVLKSLQHAGYTVSFDRLTLDQPAPPEVAGWQTSLIGWQAVELDQHRQTIFLPAGVSLDLGGIAKGWAARQAVERLQQFGPALVNAGGDLAASDFLNDGQPWLVDVADPLRDDEPLAQLALGGGGIATSGVDYRRWQVGGAARHHIIDPRSGEPAVTDVISVTIVAPDVLQAEAAAKAVLIQGSQTGLAWLEQQPELAGLLVLNDGQVWLSSKLPDYLWSENDNTQPE